MIKPAIKYKFKLDESLLMICINILNQKRINLKNIGESSPELNRLLLKLIDVSEA